MLHLTPFPSLRVDPFGVVQETLEKGTSFGAPSLHENTLAKMVIDAVPSVEMVRFTNSGTEVTFLLLILNNKYCFAYRACLRVCSKLLSTELAGVFACCVCVLCLRACS